MTVMIPKALTWARSRARAMPHITWRDEKIRELTVARNEAATELARIREELTVLDKSPVDLPSFRHHVHAEGRVLTHMRERNETDRGNLVTRKLTSYSFAQSHGVTIPQLYGVWDQPEDIAWDEVPDEVVIKSHAGTSGRGAVPLRRVAGEWTMVTGTGTIAQDEVVDRLCSFRAKELVNGPYFAEQLLKGIDDNTLPVDIKIYAFYGEIGQVLLRSAPSLHDLRSHTFRTVFEDGTDPGPIHRNYDDSIPVPGNLGELIAVAKRLSLGIPRPFVRVDLYDVGGQIVFGEFTPRPGGPQNFGPKHDERLGHLWESAHARLLSDVIDGADYGLRYGAGPRELMVGEKSYLPPADRT